MQENTIDIFDIFLYKVENFLNRRTPQKEWRNILYVPFDYEKSVFTIASKKSNGSSFLLTRWSDLFSVKKLEKKMLNKGYSESDCYAINLILSRFGYLLEINKNQRTHKDYFIFFYILQLITLKNNPIEGNGTIKNYMLRFLLFELDMDDEAYSKFKIENNTLVLVTDHSGTIEFSGIIETIYDILEIENTKEKELLATIKNYQLSIVKFLVVADNELYKIDFEDYYSDLIYPDLFLKELGNDTKELSKVMVSTVEGNQSTYNEFVSTMILMNYSFYILKEKPKHILKLKKNIKDDEVFEAILKRLLDIGMCIKKEQFEMLDLGRYFV